MDFAFPINKVAAGQDFLTRSKEVESLVANIKERRHTLIFDSKKTGKHTLVKNALSTLEREDIPYTLVYVNLFKCRTEEALLTHYTEAVRGAFSGQDNNPNTIAGGIFETLTNREDILSVPERIAEDGGSNIIVWLDEFQNILNFDQPDDILKLLEQHLLGHTHVTYIIMGTKINAMKFIMERMGCFFNFCEHITLPQLSEDDVAYHITRVFQKVGRIISKQQTRQIYEYAQANPWLIWSLANNCYNLTRGYVTDDIIKESANILLITYEMEFHEIIDSLSNYQLQLLRAVFDGEVRLNSQEVIDSYGLSSSANVHRLKEALLKKEVITFDEENVPRIIDPLFHLWLKTSYFTE